MLDDMRVLRDVVEEYRAAAAAVGLDWPAAAESPGGQPPDLVYRLFEVDHVAEQLTWLESLGWHTQRLLPGAGWLEPWPTDGEPLEYLSRSVGTPFPWRHQMPLFNFERTTYTFVLAGDREGEIWRYDFHADDWGPIRVATSLATLFAGWTKGINAGEVVYYEPNGELELRGWVEEDPRDGIDTLLERVPDVEFAAFPVYLGYRSLAPLLRERQRECGVDMAYVDDDDRALERREELSRAISATRRSLGV